MSTIVEISKTSVTEEEEEIEPINSEEKILKNREELRKKLRSKVKTKNYARAKGSKTKDKSEELNKSLMKITEILQSENIDSPEKINNNTMEKIMSVISKDDFNLLFDAMKDNPMVKDLLKNVLENVKNQF